MVIVSRTGQHNKMGENQSKEHGPQIVLLPGRAYQVAIVGAAASDGGRAREMLAHDPQFELHGADSLEDLLALIERIEVDCAIIGDSVGSLTAFSANERIRMACPNPPATLMVVAEGSEHTAVKAFRSGFADYLNKRTLDAAGLRSAVVRASDARRERLREKNQVQLMSDLAMRDSLTGLSNRHALENHLVMMMEGGLRHGKPFAVILIDIDHFKHINDTFGHFIGDHALKEFAKKLQQSARLSDVYGRMGGDEFLYLIGDGVSVESIRGACERLSIALSFSIDLENLGFSMRPSIGAAIYPIDGKNVQDLLKAADKAMYSAKSTKGAPRLAFELEAGQEATEAPEEEAGEDPSGEIGQTLQGPAQPARLTSSSDGNRIDTAAVPASGTPPDNAEVDRPGSDMNAPYSVHRLGNRRAEQRHRVLKRATVYSSDGRFTIDCVARDLSTSGARISVAGEFCVVPDHLTLLIVQSGERFTAEKRWQRGRDVGLKFSGASASPPNKTAAPAEPSANPSRDSSTELRRSRRAFVIDDDPQICAIVSKALAGRGYLASEYSRLKEVEAALALVKPELIVLDLTLGETDAIDVMKRIAATHFSGHILLISGHDMATLEEVHKIGELGGHQMLPVLQKPFRLPEFRARIEQMEAAPAASEKGELLDLALQKGWVEVWYQPKIDLRTMTVCGSEALARIRHPDRGVLLPCDFLPPPTARLNKRFSEFVIETALNDWREIADLSIADGGKQYMIAVNVPSACILSSGFVDYIRSHLPVDHANFPGLIIEITENETISDPEKLRKVAIQLRLNRITMSIDDFGAGQSTIGRLAQLPFTEIKLDRSYVHGCAKDKTKKSVCQYVLDLAHGAGMLALAEGIEEAEDLKTITDMGFDLAQGFLFSKAMESGDIIDLLEGLHGGSGER